MNRTKLRKSEVKELYAIIPNEELNFSKAFSDNTELKTKTVGELLVTSGMITACDPLSFLDTEPFIISVPVGRYPVILSMKGQTVIFTMLKLSEETAVSWKEALSLHKKEGLGIGYAVDAGIGCFMDAETANLVLEQREMDEDGFYELLNANLESNADKWANVEIDKTTGANLVAFSSGKGDGVYTSYIGFDINGNVTAIVTDFTMFGDNELYLGNNESELALDA
jgi:hypothetical protein